jgi:hypothetical protein
LAFLEDLPELAGIPFSSVNEIPEIAETFVSVDRLIGKYPTACGAGSRRQKLHFASESSMCSCGA